MSFLKSPPPIFWYYIEVVCWVNLRNLSILQQNHNLPKEWLHFFYLKSYFCSNGNPYTCLNDALVCTDKAQDILRARLASLRIFTRTKYIVTLALWRHCVGFKQQPVARSRLHIRATPKMHLLFSSQMNFIILVSNELPCLSTSKFVSSFLTCSN